MRRAFEDFVVAASTVGPLVLVLEDLHWGDVSTVEFVEGALRRCADRPLFVLGLARPEVHDLFPRLWESRGVDTIRLGGLPRRAALTLVRAILPALGDEDAERIVATADGNAFYLEELIRSIGSGRTTALPETVLAMVEARLARLETPIRRALRAASVFGETFPASGLRTVVRGPVDHELAELERLELIHRKRSAWGGDAYAFRHALVREAAYLGLSDADRRRLHRAVAHHLEAAGDTDPVVLAEHFERAEEAEAAARLWAQAAELSLRSNAHREAMARAERAIALGAAPGAQRGLQAEAASWLGDTELAWSRAGEAMSALPPGTIAWCRSLMVAALAAGELGRRDDLLALAPVVLSIPSIPGAEEPRVIAQCRVAVQYAVIGRLDILRAIEEQVEATPLPDGALLGRAWSQRLKANHGMYRADLQAFQDGSEEALRMFRAAADARSEAWQRVNVGCGLVLLGELDQGARQLELAVSAAEAMATHGVLRYGQEYLANALRRLGRLDEAAQLAAEVAVESLRRGDRSIAGQAHAEIAWCRLAEGRLDDATAEAARSADVLGPTSSHAREPQTILAAIALATGRADEALARVGPIVASSADAYWEGDVIEWVIHAEALLALGRADEATFALRSARARLDRRAACLRSPERRESFLCRVDEHARLIELSDPVL
jgi:tetratricopeptide (TPR) repeat protein